MGVLPFTLVQFVRFNTLHANELSRNRKTPLSDNRSHRLIVVHFSVSLSLSCERPIFTKVTMECRRISRYVDFDAFDPSSLMLRSQPYEKTSVVYIYFRFAICWSPTKYDEGTYFIISRPSSRKRWSFCCFPQVTHQLPYRTFVWYGLVIFTRLNTTVECLINSRNRCYPI